LTGDALLHLIPHAFIEHSSNEKKLKSYDFLDDIKLKTEHDDSHVNVYKGLGAFIGIYVFFIIEKYRFFHRYTCSPFFFQIFKYYFKIY